MFRMMMRTKDIYLDILLRKVEAGQNFEKDVPEWGWLDKLSEWWSPRIAWGFLYFFFYLAFATEWWMYLLLPLHFIMGPIHGGIVNWFGHKYGYVNFPETGDKSRNTLPFDFVTMGELFQNNHHRHPNSPNFAKRWFEFDPTYPFMKLFEILGIIKLTSVKH
jgi:stearoyl-CoA desaturase (delta-9 desaturase)